MHLTEKTKAIRTALYSMAIVGLAGAGLWLGAQTSTTHASVNTNNTLVTAPAATFAGTNLGAIPDGPGTGGGNGNLCGNDGAPRNVTFNVTGITGAPSNVAVSMTFGSPVHTYAGDVTAILIAPNGASQTVFGYTGSTIANGCGDSSALAGPYTFSDQATSPPSGGWWQAATAAGAGVNIASGTYRATNRGGAGATNPQPPVSLTTPFAGVTSPNGTWTLRLLDGGGGDTGAVSAATLTVEAVGTPTPSASPQHVVDFDGNNKTDFAVVRNTGGGSGGAVSWFVSLNGASGAYAPQWGISTDFFVPEDYDGDNKTDFVVWRSGTQTDPQGRFYILQSATNTVRIDNFGQSGDNPTVVGDYDGDNKADVAVYRAGASAGQQSVWYYRGSLSNPSGNISYVPWGQNGDFPAPGDYDGDGKNDFVVQRNNGSGGGNFYRRMTATASDVIAYGTSSDVIVPGDYDGDGKTDIAVARGSAGQINWYARRSSDGGTTFYTWGASATDYISQGDYDGDGKTDVAVWRPSATVGASAFYALGSTSGSIIVPWGSNGDYPVANFNTH